MKYSIYFFLGFIIACSQKNINEEKYITQVSHQNVDSTIKMLKDLEMKVKINKERMLLSNFWDGMEELDFINIKKRDSLKVFSFPLKDEKTIGVNTASFTIEPKFINHHLAELDLTCLNTLDLVYWMYSPDDCASVVDLYNKKYGHYNTKKEQEYVQEGLNKPKETIKETLYIWNKKDRRITITKVLRPDELNNKKNYRLDKITINIIGLTGLVQEKIKNHVKEKEQKEREKSAIEKI